MDLAVFGGVFATLKYECISTPFSNDLYDRSRKMILNLIKFASKARKDLVWNEELINFINSPIVDGLYEDLHTDPKIVCIKKGYLDVLDVFLEKMTPFHRKMFFSSGSDALTTALMYGHLDLCERIYTKSHAYRGIKYWSKIFTSVWRKGRGKSARWIVEKFPEVNYLDDALYATENSGEEMDYNWLKETYGKHILVGVSTMENVYSSAELGYIKWFENLIGRTPYSVYLSMYIILNPNEDVQDYVFSKWNEDKPSLACLSNIILYSNTPTKRRLEKILAFCGDDNVEIDELLLKCFSSSKTGCATFVFDFLIKRYNISVPDWLEENIPLIVDDGYYTGDIVFEHIKNKYELSEDTIRLLVDKCKKSRDWLHWHIVIKLTPKKYYNLIIDLAYMIIENKCAGNYAWDYSYIVEFLENYEELITHRSFRTLVDAYPPVFDKYLVLYQEILQRIHLRLLERSQN